MGELNGIGDEPRARWKYTMLLQGDKVAPQL